MSSLMKYKMQFHFSLVKQALNASMSISVHHCEIKVVIYCICEATALVNLFLTRTSGWLYMVTISGEIFTSSTNRSSRVAETGVRGSYCPEEEELKRIWVMVTNINIVPTYNTLYAGYSRL